MNKEKIIKIIKELIPYIIILIVVVTIRTFFYTLVLVSGDSMVPTLENNNLMVLKKRADIERFDIVVIDTGEDEIIKRVIALPRETISCENGVYYVNGKKQEEEYSKETNYCTPDHKTTIEKIELKDDEYFCLGDNRDVSKDSRSYGPFKKKQIKGTTSLRLFPFKKIGRVE